MYYLYLQHQNSVTMTRYKQRRIKYENFILHTGPISNRKTITKAS
nr:MAG TPA: hypothetical protein [Caudoviricetes sp.]DAI95847.1 MAG TPA: hypothetical protein [Caudoviricetes sp.]DAL38187.1 MAG TPA_asm: hypothetical protein [Bacteriophage sp.]